MGNIAIGSTNFSNVKLGTNQVKSVYLGNNLVWSNFTYLLDLFNSTPAYHAYSLRKLKNLYGGSCLRIRRTTSSPTVTTTTVDLNFDIDTNTINFNSGIVYVSGTATAANTLGAFAAGTVDGFTPSSINVVTWYDQSGNNKNVTQSTPTSQPFLVTSGNLEVIDGSVAVRFNATSTQQLSLVDSATSYNNMSCFVLSNSTSATVNTSAYGQGVLNSNTRLQMPVSISSNTFINYNTSGTFPIPTITANADRLYELICGASTTSAFSNGLQSSVTSVASVGTSNTVIRVGANGAAPSIYLNGYVKEIIAFTGFPLRTGVETNINSYYNVW